jgi:competence protein ComEA
MKLNHFLVVAALPMGAAYLSLAQSNGSIDGTGIGRSQSFVKQVAGEHSVELPEDKGKAALLRACVQCHEVDVVTRTRNTEAGWHRLVGIMVERGAELSEPETADVTAYLSKYFGKTNVNKATVVQLEKELFLTEKEAQAIVAYREQDGDIKSLEQLKSVPGVSSDKIQAKAEAIAFHD